MTSTLSKTTILENLTLFFGITNSSNGGDDKEKQEPPQQPIGPSK